MSLADVHIMMFYGCPENIILTHSTKFITITLLKCSLAYHQEIKTIEFIQYLIEFIQYHIPRVSLHIDDIWIVTTSLERPRTLVLNIMQNTLLLYYFRSYSPNLLREILRKKLDVTYSYGLGETICGRPQRQTSSKDPEKTP